MNVTGMIFKKVIIITKMSIGREENTGNDVTELTGVFAFKHRHFEII
jgi:hypothetical protein